MIETSPPTDDENKPDRYWKRDYRHEYRDYRPRYRDYRHDYRDPRGYKGGKRGYQRTSEDYNMKHGDYTSGYDGDVNYEDERYASWLLWSVKQHSAKTCDISLPCLFLTGYLIVL